MDDVSGCYNVSIVWFLICWRPGPAVLYVLVVSKEKKRKMRALEVGEKKHREVIVMQ